MLASEASGDEIAARPDKEPDKIALFTEECVRLGMEPETLCDYLDAGNRASFVSAR